MLYLGAGMRQVKVSGNRTFLVLPDFTDLGLFYCLPNLPHIATMEGGAPAIRLLVVREDLDAIPDNAADAVGLLSLDVDLSWPPQVIEDARSKLRIEDRLADKPRLTPIFFTKGSVQLMLLDAATSADDGTPPAGEVKPTEFVTEMMGAAHPALYGTNRAIFQAKLTKKGAAALAASLDGVTPIGVVYSLTFTGLQPAFHVKANVDWKKVYDHFSERKQFEFMFYESDIQKSIDKLVEDKVIQLDVTVEGTGAEAMDAEREAAMTTIRQLIFDKFFEATIKPVDAAGGGTLNDVVGAITDIPRKATFLGSGYSYHRKEVTIEELRTLDIDFSARKAAERTIYPQAHMFNLLSGSGVTHDQLVTVVNLDNVYKVLPFDILAAAAWDTDGIAGITVDLEYKDGTSGATRSKSVFLDKTKDKVTYRDWMDRTSGNVFRYKYEVVFQDGAVRGPKPKVNSGPDWREQTGTVLVINPRELYDTIQLEAMAVPEFPFNRWPAVQAMVRYRADDGSFEYHDDGVLTAAKKNFPTAFRVDKRVGGRREVRLSYTGATGEHVDTPWLPMEQDQWVVDDPYPDKLVVRAIVAGNRANIANLLVDLDYSDPVNRVHEAGMLEFSADNIQQSQSWTVNLADATKRRYKYRMTLVTKTGEFLQTGWIGTDAPSLPVGEVYVRRLTVEIATGELATGVEAVEVAVAYHDNVQNVHDEQTFRLGPRATSEWQVQLQDASKRSYSMTTTWIRGDGFNPKIGPTTTSETYLAIPGSPPR